MESIIRNGRKIETAIVRFFSLLLLFSVLMSANAFRTFAHGGEDHGDTQPVTTASGHGIVSHTARLGDLEIMLKHPLIKPDTATSVRLFITDFNTNAAAVDVSPAVDLESTAGSAVTEAAVEKNDAAGSFTVKIPALPEGTYVIRTKLTYKGETDTATFTGVEVKTQPSASFNSEETSWARFALLALIFSLVLALSGGLILFVRRSAAAESAESLSNESKSLKIKKGTVSA